MLTLGTLRAASITTSIVSLPLLALGCSTAAVALPDSGSDTPDSGLVSLDAGADDAGSCDVPLEPAPTEVLWLVDTTASWTRRADRYAGVMDALGATVTSWSSADHALARFPRLTSEGESCATADYESLDVAWPATADAILDEVEEHAFEGGSTLGPALEGAIRTARARRAEGGTVAVILLTDATPNDDETCDASAWDDVTAIAGAGLADGVHTSVLSVMSGGVSGDHFGRMAAIAAAGDGFTATVNGSRSDVARASATFLADVRDHMESCSFRVPEGVVPARIQLRTGDGATEEITRVASAAECTPAGFYLDDPLAPSTLTLCSGDAGVGGLCQRVYLAARDLGPAQITVPCD